MRFVDEARIHVASGKGGDGCVSFRREKYVPFGGPDGGNGGRGGDVVLVASRGRNTLLELRGHAIWRAANGEAGRPKQQNGAGAADVEIEVPVGTLVYDEVDGTLLADLAADGERAIVAKGGAPGAGNVAFKSSTNRTPRKAKPGRPGEERRLLLELRLVADVGLLGFPNAGKSTLISRVSAARPRIADYPFTTLVPNLGVVDMGIDGTFVVADIPGLIEGAADGAGLGHQFLRHVQRTRVLLHLLSLGPDEVLSPRARYDAIRRELFSFDPEFEARPEVIVLTKADLGADVDAVLADLADLDRRVMVVSAVSGQGLKGLVQHVWGMLEPSAP